MSTKQEAPIVVSGPGCEGRTVDSTSVGLSFAQGLACHATANGTWYVREGERVVARIERIDGLVLTFPVGLRVAS